MGRVETQRVGKQYLGAAQDAGARRYHAQTGCGGDQSATGTHQQGVLREFAQALERGTDRRLVHAQTDGRARNTAFRQHGMQDPDQMQVDPVENGMVSHTGGSMALIC